MTGKIVTTDTLEKLEIMIADCLRLADDLDQHLYAAHLQHVLDLIQRRDE